MNTADKTPQKERMTIGKFLEGNPTYTTVICSKREMTPDRGKVYQQYKPHRKRIIYINTGSKELNTYRTTEHIVWGQDGISPCIGTRLLLDRQETTPRVSRDNDTTSGEITQNDGTRRNSNRQIEQTQLENESRYPRTLQENIPPVITEVTTQDIQQHERDDSSKRRQDESHDLGNTQSKAPRAQENDSTDERWKRAKVAQS
jgi:hypothetical protein